jgi:hypothetical protein
MDTTLESSVSPSKWLLNLSAIFQIVYWGLSHLFFPGWYLRSIGLAELAADPGPTLLFIHEIGVLALGIGLVTWPAADDVIKNFAVIVMLYVVGLGSVATLLYHILFQSTASGEWVTVAVLVIQLVLLTVLYPWKELRKEQGKA